MKIGTEVVLKKFGKDETTEYNGIAIAGTENDLSIAYFDASKEALLGGVDWRNAWVRVDQVKHVDHQDVKDGKVGFAWIERGFVDRLFHSAAPVEPASAAAPSPVTSALVGSSSPAFTVAGKAKE